MNAFLQHFAFEFRTGIRNRSLLLMTYLFPLAVYVLLGMLMTEVNPLFRETLIPAMILFAVLTGAVLSLPDPLLAARKAGIFRTYRINGVPAVSILLIPALAALLHLAALAVIILASAPFLFRAPLPADWLGFLLVFLLAVCACAALGQLVGVASSSTQAAVLWAQLIFLPAMLLSGMMMPYSMLPDALARLALLLPPTHIMNAFRSLAYGLPADVDPAWSALILLAGAALAFGLAIYLFRWDEADARQRRKAPLALLALLPYALGALLIP